MRQTKTSFHEPAIVYPKGTVAIPTQETEAALADAVRALLSRGHVVHGYSAATNERVIRILNERQYSDEAGLLGYGVDGRAELALGRALLTYAMRERDGLEYITATHYSESTDGQITTGGHRSKFDNIVWTGDFTLQQEGDVVVASSHYGGNHGLSPLAVTAGNALGAIVLLTDKYNYMNDRLTELPPISFE